MPEDNERVDEEHILKVVQRLQEIKTNFPQLFLFQIDHNGRLLNFPFNIILSNKFCPCRGIYSFGVEEKHVTVYLINIAISEIKELKLSQRNAETLFLGVKVVFILSEFVDVERKGFIPLVHRTNYNGRVVVYFLKE